MYNIPRIKMPQINREQLKEVKYTEPNLDVEWEEVNRYPYLADLGQAGWIELAKQGKAIKVDSDSVKKIGNTGADGSETLADLEPEKVQRLKKAMKSGTIEMPIVMKMPNGKLELIAGNTRLIGLISTEGKAKVWYIDASKLDEGNKAQKGIPANATQAELKKARKSGGAKGKRAHWLLNMRNSNKKK